jgi:hypothetical protein
MLYQWLENLRWFAVQELGKNRKWKEGQKYRARSIWRRSQSACPGRRLLQRAAQGGDKELTLPPEIELEALAAMALRDGCPDGLSGWSRKAATEPLRVGSILGV